MLRATAECAKRKRCSFELRRHCYHLKTEHVNISTTSYITSLGDIYIVVAPRPSGVVILSPTYPYPECHSTHQLTCPQRPRTPATIRKNFATGSPAGRSSQAKLGGPATHCVRGLRCGRNVKAKRVSRSHKRPFFFGCTLASKTTWHSPSDPIAYSISILRHQRYRHRTLAALFFPRQEGMVGVPFSSFDRSFLSSAAPNERSSRPAKTTAIGSRQG